MCLPPFCVPIWLLGADRTSPCPRDLREARDGSRLHAPQVCGGRRAASDHRLPQLDADGHPEQQGEHPGDWGAGPGSSFHKGVPAAMGLQWPSPALSQCHSTPWHTGTPQRECSLCLIICVPSCCVSYNYGLVISTIGLFIACSFILQQPEATTVYL